MLPKGSNLLAYLRVSTEIQEEEGDWRRTQMEVMSGTADRHEWNIVATVPDGGESSKSLDRAGLQWILGVLSSGRIDDGPQIDGIIVPNFDRLTRNLADACFLVDKYFGRPGGPTLVSSSEPIDVRDVDGEMFFYLIILLSQWQRKKGILRTLQTLESKKKNRERLGRDKFGMRIDASDPARSKKGKPIKYVPDEVDMQAVAFVHARKRRGRSLQGIADDLTDAGYPTKRGNPRWSKSTVVKILKRYPLPPEQP